MKSDEICGALLSIEKMIQGPEFETWRKQFVDRNLEHFSFEDENKLIYTDIHKEYEEGIEKLIEQSLPPGTDMGGLMEALPAYLESSEAHREETARTVKLLLEIGDFKDFREMMLYAKRQKEEEGESGTDQSLSSLSGGGSVFEVDGLIEMCGLLADTGANEDGWVTVYQNKWMRIDKKVSCSCSCFPLVPLTFPLIRHLPDFADGSPWTRSSSGTRTRSSCGG